MSSHHYSHYSQTVKTKGKNKFQSYNTEEGYERKSVNTLYNKYNKYNNKNYFRTDEKGTIWDKYLKAQIPHIVGVPHPTYESQSQKEQNEINR